MIRWSRTPDQGEKLIKDDLQVEGDKNTIRFVVILNGSNTKLIAGN